MQKEELDEMLQEQAESKGKRAQRPWELFSDRTVRWQLVSVAVISSAMQLCGNDSVSKAVPQNNSDSFIHLQYLLYPGQGYNGTRLCPGNTGHESGIHNGWDKKTSYKFIISPVIDLQCKLMEDLELNLLLTVHYVKFIASVSGKVIEHNWKIN